MNENQIGSAVIDCAVRLHIALGPGLLESVYQRALAHMLEREGFTVDRHVPIPFEFEGMRFEEGFRADLVVEDRVILELKSVEMVTPAHQKQLLTYLRLSGLKLGYLLNFGRAVMKEGIYRIINGIIH
jgi:GxxExxY protein